MDMRIAISGCANSGKTTLHKAFKNKWPMYQSPTKTYRDVLTENNLEHSSKTTEETQLVILNWMMEEQAKYPKGSNVVYDRCPWDNLAYTLQGNSNGLIGDDITAATISFVKESMKELDIIFWIKQNKSIKVVKDALRDTNEAFIRQTDQVFQQLFDQYMDNLEIDVFYPKEDCPAIICIDEHFSTVDDRLMFIGEFIDYRGNLIETENSILDPNNVDLLTEILGDQAKEMNEEERLKAIMKAFKPN
jgi:predicted ATPase